MAHTNSGTHIAIQILNLIGNIYPNTQYLISRIKYARTSLFSYETDSFQNFKRCLTDNRNFAKVDTLLFMKGGKRYSNLLVKNIICKVKDEDTQKIKLIPNYQV